jgi:hypothetical protein
MKNKNTVMTKHLTDRKIGNVFDTLCPPVREYMLTGGGGNSLYYSHLGVFLMCGDPVQTGMPPKVTACSRIPARERSVFPHHCRREKQLVNSGLN